MVCQRRMAGVLSIEEGVPTWDENPGKDKEAGKKWEKTCFTSLQAMYRNNTDRRQPFHWIGLDNKSKYTQSYQFDFGDFYNHIIRTLHIFTK